MNAWLLALAVGGAGAAGSVLRVWVDSLTGRIGAAAPRGTARRAAGDSAAGDGAGGHTAGPAPWPWGTLSVNGAGSLLMGVGVGLLAAGVLTKEAAVVLGAGFCGGLTTFSSFGMATVLLWNGGRRMAAAANVAANLVLGLGCAGVGLWLGAALTR